MRSTRNSVRRSPKASFNASAKSGFLRILGSFVRSLREQPIRSVVFNGTEMNGGHRGYVRHEKEQRPGFFSFPATHSLNYIEWYDMATMIWEDHGIKGVHEDGAVYHLYRLASCCWKQFQGHVQNLNDKPWGRRSHKCGKSQYMEFIHKYHKYPP